jgi:hypothetical protein
LLLGEGIRREPTALTTVASLLAAIDAALARWLGENFPELTQDPAVAARTVRHLLVSRLVEGLAAEGGEAIEDEAWAREVAAVLLG